MSMNNSYNYINCNYNNNNDTDSQTTSESEPTDSSTTSNIGTSNNSTTLTNCMCTSTPPNHITIKFFDKQTVVCLNNKNARCVVNLSSYDLTEQERSILLKGLKFCPTPGEPNMQEIRNDLKSFFRKLKLRDYFYEEENEEPNDPTQPTLDSYLSPPITDVDLTSFKLPSTWEPDPQLVDPAIETFSRAVMDEIRDFTPRCPRVQNLTEEEREIFQKLNDNKTIQIKKADKGSAVVLMDTTDYIKEAERQLADTKYYVRTSEDLTEKHCEQITEVLDRMVDNDELDHENYLYLLPANSRTARFYFFPKIHKKLVVGRPIISGNGCPTEKISAFVDEHIKQYVKTFPSYVRDTTDFISKLRSLKTNQRIILVTMDVTSLYTNIPNNEGKTAIHRTLVEKKYNGRASIRSIMDLLECVLHKNNFEFNDRHYLQIGGTAMGTKLAPSYSCIYMSQLEKKLLERAPYKPEIYLRFIDDIFCAFCVGEQQVHEFIDYMNSCHHSIKFTAEISTEQVTFLDTIVKIDPITNEIYTDLHTKDTDTQNYLSYDSCHPIHCKKGGPYGEFLRIRRNCQRLEDYDKHSLQRVKDYERRGYPTKDLVEAREKARNQDREQLLIPKRKQKKKESDRIPLLVTYNPGNPNFQAILDRHWHLLQLCNNKEAFSEKAMVAYRRPKNFSDQLVRAKCSTSQTERPKQNPNMHPCKTPWNCKFCPKKDRQKCFRSTMTGRTYTRPAYTCNTRNVVYLITCNLCKKQYVGETYRSFRERMIEHERYVRRKTYSQATGLHYNTMGHKVGHMKYEVIYCLWKKPVRNDPVRKDKEIKWMEQLKTFKPDGLNDKGK